MTRFHLTHILRSRIPAPVLAIFLSTILTPMAALGSDPDSEAAEFFEEGKELFKAGQFGEAANAFREAYRLRPNWKLLYNLGQSEAAAKRYGFAIEAFEQYLAEGGDDVTQGRQDQILEELDRFRGKVGELRVEGPEGALVEIDGIRRGHIPLSGILRLVAGIEHDLVVSNEEGVLHRQQVKVAGRGRLVVDVTVEDEEETVEAQPDPVVPEDAREGSAGLGPFGWVLFSAGAVAAIAGGITGGVALSKGEDLKNDCPDYQCEGTAEERSTHQSAERLAMATNVLIPVGATLALTGIILVVVDKKKGARTERPVEVAPTVSATGAGIAIGGRF